MKKSGKSIKKHKLYIVTIIGLLTILIYFISSFEYMNIVSARFYGPIELNGINVWVNSNNWYENINKTVIEKSSCIELGQKTNKYYLLADVDDNYITVEDCNIEITVEYYDTGRGMFALQYNSKLEAGKQTEIVYMQNEKRWKKYTFVLDDAAFRNALNNSDFWIGTYIPSIGGFSEDNIYIRGISVHKSTKQYTGSCYAKLGYQTTFKNINAIVQGNYGKYDAIENKKTLDEFWILDPKKDKIFILFDVAQSYIDIDDNNIEIIVKYLDEGYGMFEVQYNSSLPEYNIITNKIGNIFNLGDKIEITLDISRQKFTETEVVTLKNTGKWLEHRFIINDAAFCNNIYGGDFRICSYIESKQTFSSTKILIKSVTVVKNTIQGEKLSDKIPINYSIVDLPSGKKVMGDQFVINLLNGKAVVKGKLNIEYNGMFRMDIDLKDDKTNKTISKSALFTGMPEKDKFEVVNDIFGVSTHIGKNWVDKTYTKDFVNITQNANIDWIRDEMEWEQAEKIKGSVEILPEWDNYIELLTKANIKPLIILDFGNKFYDDGGFPYTEEGINAFLNYVKTIVTHFKGKVNHFELWNEFNLVGSEFNPTSKTSKDYVSLLKLVYEEIKSINPEATLIGGATSGVDLKWLKEILDAGAIDYMDALSFHPYCYPNSPEDGEIIKGIDNIYALLGKYKGDIPIWITEIGWPTYLEEDGVSEEVAAAFLVRTYVEGITHGVNKIFWYNLHNKGTNQKEMEENFGLIKSIYDESTPMAAKGSYIAYNMMTEMLKSANFVSDISIDNIKAYHFRDNNIDKDIIVIWSKDNSEENISINNVSNEVIQYSMYAHNMNIIIGTNNIKTITSGYPIYIVYNSLNKETIPNISILDNK